MADHFNEYRSGLESPATDLAAVTPDDDTDLPIASRGINVVGSGTIQVTTVGGTIGSIYVVAGGAFPLRARRIWQSGTTATGITVLY